MSNPANILSTFRSYSYHHVLIACDGIKTATALARNSEITLFQHPRDAERFSARQIEGGNYVVLINGMVDTRFSIQKASWYTVIAPSTNVGGMSYADTIETDGELIVQEPKGVKFLNILAETCNELQTDPTGLVFLLKTIFVGLNDDGSTELIPNIRPFLMVPIDISAVIDQAGAIYTLAFAGVNNGVTRLPQISRIAEGFSFRLNSNETVASALRRAFRKINDENYQNFKTKLKKQLESTTPKINIDLDNDFREVYYDVSIDPEYENVRFVAGTNEKVQTEDKEGQPILQFGPNPTVENIVRQIMQSSSEVLTESNGNTEDGRKYIYKIVSGLKEDNGEDQGKYIVQYQVQRYEVKTNPFEVNGVVKDPVPGEYIEFDYLFTGKNVDIIDFDIKMELGMAFFQTVATTNNLGNQKQVHNKVKNTEMSDGKGGNIGQASPNFKKRPKTPLYLGARLKDPLIRNKQFPVDTISFNALLSRHAAFENIEASIKIHGNPQLMDEMLPLPEDIERGRTEDSKENQTINPSWMKTPTLVKVNIRMPASNDLENFSEPFWYRGFYSLFAITNTFDEGLFTQDLEMFSLPVSQDFNDRVTDISDEEEEQTAKQTAEQTAQDLPPSDIPPLTPEENVPGNVNEQTAKQKMNNLVKRSNRRR